MKKQLNHNISNILKVKLDPSSVTNIFQVTKLQIIFNAMFLNLKVTVNFVLLFTNFYSYEFMTCEIICSISLHKKIETLCKVQGGGVLRTNCFYFLLFVILSSIIKCNEPKNSEDKVNEDI